MLTVGAERVFLVEPVVSAERILIEAIIEARAPSTHEERAKPHNIP
jgi:hypothetical protein